MKEFKSWITKVIVLALIIAAIGTYRHYTVDKLQDEVYSGIYGMEETEWFTVTTWVLKTKKLQS